MSLIAHYPLNGDARDYFGNDGSVSGATFTDGLLGQAAYFDGAYDTISFGVGNDLFPLPQFSCAIWFNSFGTTATTGTTPSIFGLTYGIRLRVFANYISFGLDNGTTFIYTNSPSTYDFYNSSIWHHAVVTATATRMSLFVNGVLVSTRSTTWPGKTQWGTNPLNIGCDNNNNNYYFRGLLQDFKIYDHALSEKEVRETYKALVLSKFPEVNDNTVNSGNFITVPDSPTILGSTSIEMWLYPTSTSTARQTIWNNGYGGEGTINFESSSRELRFYSGYGGGNGGGYESLDSSAIPLNVWTHVVVTRAMPSGDVKWYLNGQLDTTGNFSFSTIGETTFDLTIGSGYTSDFVGKLQGVRQYATELSADDVQTLYKTGLAIDNIGNIHGKYFVESGIVNPNILDYTTWTLGTGGVSGFYANGATNENYRITDTDPHGRDTVVWEARPEATSGADGGWNGSYYPIDNTKFYRFAVWIRRTVSGNGSMYFGLHGGSDAVQNRSNNASNTNPYFISGGQGSEWTLYVGHVWPAGSGSGGIHPETGRYTVSDGKTGSINDFVWGVGTTSTHHRSYLYYSTDTSTRQQFVYPRVDLIDGTEPSVQALLGGFDSINYERTLELGSSSVADHPSIKYHKVNVGQFSEVGVTDSVSSFLPFNRKYTDVALGSTPVTTNPSGFTSVDGHTGIDFSGVANDDARYSLTDPLQLSEDWTISFFIYPRSFSNMNSYSIFITFFSFPYIAVDGGGNNLRVSLANSSSSQISYTAQGSSLSINQWALVTVVHDSANSKIKLFKNGILLSEQTSVPLQVKDFTQFNIGNYTSSNYYTDGVMRNLKIFKTALTPEEVAQEYNSGKASLTKNTAFAKEFIEV